MHFQSPLSYCNTQFNKIIDKLTQFKQNIWKYLIIRVYQGIFTVRNIQHNYKHPLFDIYFTATSFLAEEEFYLLMLPFLFWNGAFNVATHLNFIICLGLLVGNSLKMIFKLPRPKKVSKRDIRSVEIHWIHIFKQKLSNKGNESDTNCEYGFPSTHAINSVTNTITAIIFFYDTVRDIPLWTLLLTIIWISSLTFGRIYLGAHTPVDIISGLIIGLIITLTYCIFTKTIGDNWIYQTQTYYMIPQILIWATSCLYVSPLKTPPGTFYQNTACIGLLTGSCIGLQYWDYTISSTSFTSPIYCPTPAYITYIIGEYIRGSRSPILSRWVFGLLIVQSIRLLSTSLLSTVILTLFKIDIRDKCKNDENIPTKSAFIGVNIIKFINYNIIGFCVLFAIPTLYQMAGAGVY